MNKTRATRSCMTNGIFFINKNNVEVDRIGSLPDEVLTHILSFLSTKEAVQTCILSKRWRNTWATVPVLDIKQKHSLIDYSYKELRMSLARFEWFMAGFLDNRAPTNLNRVRCACQSDASMGWLDRVVLLMPLQIHIFILSNGNSLDMLDLVFSCASLQHLLITIIRPVSINLPSLKFLELTWVELHADFAQKLFVGCPSLERLILCCCNLYFSVMSSEVLKELTLSSCGLHEQMQIFCPALVSLFMRIDHKRSVISLKNMSSLVSVVVKLYWDLDDEVPVLNFYGGVSNAAKLESHLETPLLMEQLEKDIPNCSIFNNLKKLVVGGKCNLFYDFTLIAYLLKHSPNLKELGLLLLDESQGQIQEPRREDLGDVLFQYEYLEIVKISDEYGGKLSNEQIVFVAPTAYDILTVILELPAYYLI